MEKNCLSWQPFVEVQIAENDAVAIKSGWKKVPDRNHVGGQAYPIRTSDNTVRDIKSLHSDSLLVNPESASKVVDEDGNPLVLYHGSYAKFNITEPDRAGAIYFSPNKAHAIKGYGPNVVAVYLNIRKLADLTDPNSEAYKIAVDAFNSDGDDCVLGVMSVHSDQLKKKVVRA